MPASLISMLAVVLYLLALLRQGQIMLGRIKGDRALVLSLGGAALLLHGALISQRLWTPDGLDLGLLQVADLVAWLLGLCITLAATRLSVIVLIPPVYLYATATLCLLQWVPVPHITALDAELSLHISLALVAYTLLLIGALYHLLLTQVSRFIKQHKINRLPGALPPLLTMERHLFQLLCAGWVVLTLAVGTGLGNLQDIHSSGALHKLVLVSLGWLLYGLLLLGHWRWGWRGRASQWLNFSGIVLLTLGYFGSRLVLDYILARG